MKEIDLLIKCRDFITNLQKFNGGNECLELTTLYNEINDFFEPPKPEWHKAPDWAMWWAADDGGYCWWFQEKPDRDMCCWYSEIGEIRFDREIALNGIDWRNTLNKRPEQ